MQKTMKLKYPATARMRLLASLLVMSLGLAVHGRATPKASFEINDDRGDNIALGKKVSGRDGASHGKGLAAHVTDGDYSTHAKPPAFHFNYTVDLRTENDQGFSVGEIAIHWAVDGNGCLPLRSLLVCLPGEKGGIHLSRWFCIGS